MKMFIVLAVFVAVASAGLLPHKQGGHHHHRQGQDDQSVFVVQEKLHDNIGVDGYQYKYELSDGQQREESAQLVNAGTENEAIVVRGSFTWYDPATNQEYTIRYTADENGFHPEGAHIPSV